MLLHLKKPWAYNAVRLSVTIILTGIAIVAMPAFALVHDSPHIKSHTTNSQEKKYQSGTRGVAPSDNSDKRVSVAEPDEKKLKEMQRLVTGFLRAIAQGKAEAAIRLTERPNYLNFLSDLPIDPIQKATELQGDIRDLTAQYQKLPGFKLNSIALLSAKKIHNADITDTDYFKQSRDIDVSEAPLSWTTTNTYTWKKIDFYYLTAQVKYSCIVDGKTEIRTDTSTIIILEYPQIVMVSPRFAPPTKSPPNLFISGWMDPYQFNCWFFDNNFIEPETICSVLEKIAPGDFTHATVENWMRGLDQNSRNAFVNGDQRQEARAVTQVNRELLTQKYEALYKMAQKSHCDACLLNNGWRAAVGNMLLGHFEEALQYLEAAQDYYDTKEGQFVAAKNNAMWINRVYLAMHDHRRRAAQFKKNLTRAEKAKRPLDALEAMCQYALVSRLLDDDPLTKTTPEEQACEMHLRAWLEHPVSPEDSVVYRATVYEWLATFSRMRGNVEGSVKESLLAKAAWESSGSDNRGRVALACKNIADSLMLAGRYTEALHYGEQALHNYEAVKDVAGQASSYQVIGSIYFRKGDKESSGTANEKAISLSDPSSDATSFLHRIHNRASTDLNEDRAFQAYFQAIASLQACDDVSEAASTYEAIAVIYGDKGNYRQSKYFHELSLRMGRLNENHVAQSRAHESLGNIEQGDGKWEAAGQEFALALGHAQLVGDAYDIARIQIDQIDLLAVRGRLEEALEQCDALLVGARLRDESYTIKSLLREKAYILYKSGNFNDAADLLRNLIGPTNPAIPTDLWAHYYLGQTLEAQGDKEGAVRELRLSAAVLDRSRKNVAGGAYEEGLFSSAHLQPSYDLTDIYLSAGREWDALEASDSVRGQSLRDVWQNGRAAFMADIRQQQHNSYQTYIEQLSVWNQQIYRFSRLPKFQASSARDIFDQLDGARLRTEQTQHLTIAAYRQFRRAKAEKEESQTTVANISLRHQTVGAKTACLEYQVRGDVTYVFVVTTDPITNSPRLKTLVLEISSTDLRERVERFRHHLLVDTAETRGLSDSDNERQRVLLGEALYKDLILPCLPFLVGIDTLCIVPDDWLWRLPFCALMPSDTLKSARKVELPLKSTEHYLIDDFAIYYAPSLTALCEIRSALPLHTSLREKARESQKTLLAVADPWLEQLAPTHSTLPPSDFRTPQEWSRFFAAPPKNTLGYIKTVPGTTAGQLGFINELRSLQPLPDAKKQVKELRYLFPQKSSKLLESIDADEPTVKREANRYRMIHFAAHAVLDDENPLYSRIILSQTERRQLGIKRNFYGSLLGSYVEAGYSGPLGEDGALETWEVAQMSLSADLVVLACCQTAQGQYNHGEGLVGLAWAFLQARCPRVVGTQWSVSPGLSTPLLINFYKGLNLNHKQKLLSSKSTMNSAKALRNAMLAAKADFRTKSPRYWAGFVLIGDGN